MVDLSFRVCDGGGVERVGDVVVRMRRGAAVCQVSGAQSRDETSALALPLRGFAWYVCRMTIRLEQRGLGILLSLWGS